jgi:hypothetical protein
MPADVGLLRGAEGRYARWSKAHSGPYDGFLLSSANSFPAQLAAILDDHLPRSVLEAVQASVARHGLAPAHGYLEHRFPQLT